MTARRIYRSPGINAPDLSSAFPYASELDHDNGPRHQVIGDKGLFASCGYSTHDEAAILWKLASLNRGLWMEIGAHTGWVTAHLAVANNIVVALEPEFKAPHYNVTGDAEQFFRRFACNVAAALGSPRVWEKYPLRETIVLLENDLLRRDNPGPQVLPVGECSWDCIPQIAERLNGRFSGVFVDGEHEPPFPLVDAMLVAPLLATDSVVVFHDAIGSPVVAGVNWLAEWGKRRGWPTAVRRFSTPQHLTAVFFGLNAMGRGASQESLVHTPDPAFDWSRYNQQIDGEVAASLAQDYSRWCTYARGWTRRPLNEH